MRKSALSSLLPALLALPSLLSAGEPTIALPADTFVTREPVPITLTGLPGNPQDWLTLVAAKKSDDSFGVWEYTKGVTEGTWTFTAPRPGDYEVRVYFDYPAGGFTVQARKAVKILAKAAPVEAPAEAPDAAVPPVAAQPRVVDKPIAPDPYEQAREQLPQRKMQGQANQPQVSVTPAEIQQEADDLYAFCVKPGAYSSFNDCQCIREKFVQERTANPVRGVDPVQMARRFPPTACPNAEGVRTFHYRQCGTTYANTIKSGLEEFCACYADEIKARYVQQPTTSSSAMTRYAGVAMSTCDQRGLPSPMNPDRQVAGADEAEPPIQPDERGFIPLPDGFCRPANRSPPAVTAYRSCNAAKDPESVARPGFRVNVDYHRCVYSGITLGGETPNEWQVQQDCEKKYGKGMIPINN